MTARPASVRTTTGRSPPVKSTQPAVTLGVLAQCAKRRRAIQAVAGHPRIVFAAQELDRELQPELPVHARHRAQGLAHHERDVLRVRVLSVQRLAHVAAPASVQGLRLVPEIAQDRVVAAASALDPAHQLEKETPLVGEHGLATGIALEEAAAQRHVVG
jgi:hypothetical protein